jgi:N-methylhydantoinase A
MTPDGPLRPLSDDGVAEVLRRVRELDPEAVAVCLLHAYRHPQHERAIGDALAALGVHVSLSHEAVGTFREYERAATTEVDAALSPLLADYLRRLVQRAADAGLPRPDVMQSSGGLAAAAEAAAHAATTVLSGPAGGAAGAAWAAAGAGEAGALCFDMGGTSCDVCVIEDGAVREASGRTVGGRPIALPMLDLHTVGAGGGSLVRRDAGGALRVGPESAGADPGPACYGRGGGPTVTDANLLLDRLPAELPGGLVLDRAAAAAALDGVDPAAVVEVVNSEMLRALRVVSVERGHDPREFALVAYGGAGPLHACALAEELGMEAVLVPAAAGVLSALGLAAGDERRDRVISHVRPLDEVGKLPPEGEADLRYRGQSFELTVPLGGDPDLAERFHLAHEDRYGYADRGREVELVAVRTAEVVAGPELALPSHEPEHVSGPALVQLDGSTVWIPPGWEGARDGPSWVLTRE